MASGWTCLQLDEVETLPWMGTELEWRPLREAIGSRIVGMAAFTASRAGQELIEEHSEEAEGRGHEEVYVVLRGRATFTVDDEALDAPAGTFLRVDPEISRCAVAAEAGTAVLALGGPPTFEPSASEWIERARPLLRSDPNRARELLDDLRRARPESPGVAIGEALYARSQGDVESARELVASVISAHPELRTPLAQDPDLGSLVDAP